MYSYELRAHLGAGLSLVGREDGEYQWMGSRQQWRKMEEMVADYERHEILA